MKKYKVLTHDMKSLVRYSDPYELGKEYVCEDFDSDEKRSYSRGYHAKDIEGLALEHQWRGGNSVFEVEVSGGKVIRDQFDQRFEKMKILREVALDELKELIKNVNCGYDLHKVLFPTHPLTGEPKEVTEGVIDLLNEFISIRTSVTDNDMWTIRGSVRDSIWCSFDVLINHLVYKLVERSVGVSVRNLVVDSVQDTEYDPFWGSIWDSVYCYIGSMFYGIKEWMYIEHEPGVYPFQSCADLWERGFVTSFDGTTWRLHSGKDAEIVYTIQF